MNTGWVKSELGEIYDVRDGTHDSPKYYAVGYPLITSKNLKPNGLSFDDVKLINESDFEKINQRSAVNQGDVLFAMIGTIGNPTLVDVEPNFAIKNVALFKIAENQSGPFLKYYLESDWVKSKMAAEANGTTQKFVGLGYLRNFPIELPPLPEQHRIVAILDEAFDGITTAKANAEKNLQNARALFESHLQAVFSQRGEEWVKKTVKEIASPAKGSIRTGPFGSQLLHSEFVDEGIAVLGIDNAVANEFRWGKSRFITPEKYRQLDRYTVHPGDVLITIMGTCGRCAIVPDDIPTAINTKHICCITLDHTLCLPSYLHIYFLHAPQSQEFLAKHAKGAIMAGLNMGLIQELPVMLPPIKYQAAIVLAADDLRKETQHLDSIYQQKLAALAELKKSLLHQAFSGQL